MPRNISFVLIPEIKQITQNIEQLQNFSGF